MDAAYHLSGVGAGLVELSKRHWRTILAAVGAALLLRLVFILKFPFLTPDGQVYGDLAKNWLLHGVYGMSGAQGPEPSFIRLPGYPAFLAGVWALLGVEHYNAVRYVQMLVDVGTCFVIADIARRTVSERAALAALWLAALCPFLANYAALPLTETLAVFFTALALDLAIQGCDALLAGRQVQWSAWAACGLCIATGLYLRPDAGVLLMVVGAYLVYRWARMPGQRAAALSAGLVLAFFALAPLTPWAIRNWRVMHRFQPLAPAGANAVQEFVPRGFGAWQATWLAEFASLEDISFRVDGEPLNTHDLPARAFDTEDERRRVEELFAAYNENLEMTPAIDGEFARLAQERIRRSPLRYHVWLPVLRALDMWLRPRTEMLPVDSHWWRYREDPRDFAVSVAFGLVNLAYVAMAIAGVVGMRIRYAGLLVGFVIVRTVLVTAIAGPEPRYVLECYPVVIVFAAAALARIGCWTAARPEQTESEVEA